MTNKTKAAIEEAATKAWEDDVKHNPNPNNPYAYRYGFKHGAQHVIENPGEWGLVEKRLVDAGIQLRIETVKACEETHLQNEKYREALEKSINIVHSLSEPIQELIDVLEGVYYEGK